MITKQEIDIKFSEAEDLLRSCTRVRIKSSPNRSVVHKREYGYRYENSDGDTIAIVFFYFRPDGTEEKSVRLVVIGGITYKLQVLPLPSK